MRRGYGRELLAGCPGAYRCVIGRGVGKVLDELGVTFEHWVDQPQARAVAGVDLDRGWPELLQATTQGTSEV